MPPRRNPMTFDNRFKVTPEVQKSIRTTKDRSLASALSTATHRAIERETAASPHNFCVVVVPKPELRSFVSYSDYNAADGAWRKELQLSLPRPEAVTLVFAVRNLGAAAGTPKHLKAGIFSAFTYLHRLGDKLAYGLFLANDTSFADLVGPNERSLPLLLSQGYPINENPEEQQFGTRYQEDLAIERILRKKGIRDAVDKANADRELYERLAKSVSEGDKGALYRYIGTHVNSKMVREGYSNEFSQSLADLFPLCEFTPPSRPLFLPFDKARMAMPYPESNTSRDWKQNCSERTMDICNAYGAAMNVRFRDLYNTLIPALYGSVWFISD